MLQRLDPQTQGLKLYEEDFRGCMLVGAELHFPSVKADARMLETPLSYLDAPFSSGWATMFWYCNDTERDDETQSPAPWYPSSHPLGTRYKQLLSVVASDNANQTLQYFGLASPSKSLKDVLSASGRSLCGPPGVYGFRD
jgi:hypothetical protein